MPLRIPTIHWHWPGQSLGHGHTPAEIHGALSSIGAFRLRHHSINEGKINEYFELNRRVCSLSIADKTLLSPPHQSLQNGYFGKGVETIRGRRSLKESFDFKDPSNDTLGSWPREHQLPGFREAAGQFHKECHELAIELLHGISAALNLTRDDALGQYHTGSMFTSSFTHSPPCTSFQPGPGCRQAAHCDLSTITLLFQQDIGGLEIADMSSTDVTRSKDVDQHAQFIYVDPEPGILVLSGYFLDRWTSGMYRGAVHRVSAPEQFKERPNSDRKHMNLILPERYSIAYFCIPDAAVIIKPLPSCVKKETASKRPLSVGDFPLKKRALLYS